MSEINEYLSIRREWVVENEPFFIFQNGDPVRTDDIRSILRFALAGLKLNESLYDTHSFRIGRATDLFKMGRSVEDIKRVGRWKSSAVYKYLRE